MCGHRARFYAPKKKQQQQEDVKKRHMHTYVHKRESEFDIEIKNHASSGALTSMGRPHEPIFQASPVVTANGPVHSDWPNTSKMWMLRDAKYSKV